MSGNPSTMPCRITRPGVALASSRAVGPDGVLRVAGTANDSITDGPGIRFTIFTQGCPHDCPGCHNPQTHAVDAGTIETVDALWERVVANPLLSGITLSGGEPMLQPIPLARLARRARARGLSVWCYTGYRFERLLAGEPSAEVLDLLGDVDVLVDGPFVQRLKSLSLTWCGSSNQRLIDVPASLGSSTVTLWNA